MILSTSSSPYSNSLLNTLLNCKPFMKISSRFLGCIKDLKYSEGYTDLVLHSPISKSRNIVNYCENYCHKNTTKPQCSNGACVNKFKDYSCDCFGTGYEGKYCNKSKFFKTTVTVLKFIVFILESVLLPLSIARLQIP